MWVIFKHPAGVCVGGESMGSSTWKQNVILNRKKASIQMHQRNTKRSKGTKRVMSSIKGVTHLSKRAKTRLLCKLQLWMWRKRQERCRLGIFKGRKRKNSVPSPCLGLKAQLLKKKRKKTTHHLVNNGNAHLPPLADSPTIASEPGCQEENIRKQTEAVDGSSCSDNRSLDTNHSAGSFKNTSQITVYIECEELQWDSEANPVSAQRTDDVYLSENQNPAGVGENQTTPTTERRISDELTTCLTNISLTTLVNYIEEFLSEFYQTYGSFIPLHNNNVLSHLSTKVHFDISESLHWKNLIFSEVKRCREAIELKPAPALKVDYKKHTLTLDDLLTLADQNWLNDQVMNMYGELIVEASHHKVHFHNSFFHRQLMTKGYDGVKRWTKKVDLFSKSLLLVPIHLEVHWCLVAADITRKKICIYDSQGNGLQKVARNILKYLISEAKEKNQTAFENGWIVSFDEKVPQQTNENDCGVFVLEYSRCLALNKPLQFSQIDIPKIRKRIYRELCDCQLHQLD